MKMDLLSGFKDCFFGKIGYKYDYMHCISSFKHKPFKISLLKGQKALDKLCQPSLIVDPMEIFLKIKLATRSN